MSWWQKYFLEAYPLISRQIKSEDSTFEETQFIDYWMQQNNYQTVLDVPCSHGRIAVTLAAMGHQVTALDINPDLLEIGREQAKNRTVEVDFIQGDMIRMDYKEAFDMVVCIFNSFGYFTDAENEAFLANAYHSLKKGGTFLIESHITETLLPIFTPYGYWRYEDCIVIEDRTFDYKTNRMEGTWTFVHDDGRKIESDSSVRIYSYNELMILLEKQGFKNIQTFGNYQGDPFVFGDDMILIAAEK